MQTSWWLHAECCTRFMLTWYCLQTIIQLASVSWGNVSPTFERLGQRHTYNVGPLSICSSAQCRHSRAGVEPTLRQCWAIIQPMLWRHWANVWATLGGHMFANNLLTFWSTFCQISANIHHPLAFWYCHIIFRKLNMIFDGSKMPKKCHISRHVLVHALKHDNPLTSLRHQGNMPVTSQILTKSCIFCLRKHGYAFTRFLKAEIISM